MPVSNKNFNAVCRPSFAADELLEAIDKCDTAKVKSLLEQGADPGGYAELSRAICRLSLEIVELLLDKGANIKEKDPDLGYTPLFDVMHAAAFTDNDKKNRLKMAGLLIERGVPLNEKIGGGRTALMRAITNEYPTIVESLIAKGADLDVKDDQGRTAKMIAEEYEHFDIAEMLKEASATRQRLAKEKSEAEAARRNHNTVAKNQQHLKEIAKNKPLKIKPA